MGAAMGENFFPYKMLGWAFWGDDEDRVLWCATWVTKFFKLPESKKAKDDKWVIAKEE